MFDNGRLASSGQYVQVGDEHGEKLANFFEWLSRLIRDLQPDDTVFEAPYAGRHRRYTFGVLSKYVGVVELTHFHCLARELPAENKIAAHAVKRALGVPKGQTHDDNKRLMVAEINQVYGLALRYKKEDRAKKVTEDDRADAIAVGRAWLLRYHADWL